PGRTEPWTCTVLWHRHDEPRGTGVDTALLRVDDRGFRAPRALPPLGWGRLSGTRGSRRVEAVGFPAGMELLTGGALAFRDSAHVTGEITLGSRLKADRYEIALRTPVPPAQSRAPVPPSAGSRSRPASRWSGMSGAGVVCEGLLVGLVGVDPGDPSGSLLTAVPVESVLADPEAARLLGGVRPRSVELAPVLLPPPAPPGSPAGVLRAEVSPVRCHGRDDLIAGLTGWCQEPGEFSLRLLTAPGGQGKTRLARELVERMTDAGWAAGFLDDQCLDDRLGLLATLSDPLLLVMDYAETRPEQLRLCLRALRPGAGSGTRVRLLLLARGAGEWWRHARAVTRVLRELPTDAVQELEPLAPDAESRAEAFRRAVDELGPALAALPGVPEGAGSGALDPRGGPGTAPRTVPRLDGRRYSGALALNMAALTALLERHGPSPGKGDRVADEEEALLLHEERYWTQTAAAHGIDHLHPATLRQLVAGATLHRAATLPEAHAFLADLGCMKGETANTRLAAAVWLHELYGGQDSYWTGLAPDPLGAYQAGSTLRDFPELLHEIAGRAPRSRAGHLLRVLCRARESFPELRERIIGIVTARPRPLAFAAVDLMTQEPDEALAAALDTVLADTASDGELSADLLSAVPRHTEVLARPALSMARQSVTRLRAAPDTAPARLADALLALAYRLSATGHHPEAVEAAEEAVRIRLRSGLGHGRQDARAELIDVLLGYGARLDEVGRHEEAARVGDRLLALSGDDAGDPAGGTGDTGRQERLARILHHHACWCHRAGRSAEALRAGARSVAIRGLLAAREPGRPSGELAGSLLNHALYLQAAGTPEAAVEPLGEAVATLRRLVEESPDGHLAALGRALHDQSRLHSALREPAPALACAEEAVAIHRRLAGDGTSPPRTADLAAVLVGLAARMADAGRSGPALDALAEAVALRRTLAADGGPAATGRLAVTLTDHAVLLRQAGRPEDAERVTDEAVRALTAARAAGWSPAGPTVVRILMHRGFALTARDPAAAREFLRRAAADAVRCGAAELADRCEAALSDLGAGRATR
ncbi:tetratricopeptide repeat protein, partial [Streptomyces kebangsaanensis]|uniref:tetratricopeptide repeat protein n=1 Tax=Streptomyces kebangsaanensis TaxID=864058 RepID=UPI001F177D45